MSATVVGCSFTVGSGLELEKIDPSNYVNIVGDKLSTKIKNLGKIGNSNYNIFLQALEEILFNTPDIIFVQWTGLNREWLHPGPDAEFLVSIHGAADFQYRNISFTADELTKFSEMYHLMMHDYKHLLELIRYSKILSSVSDNRCRIVFLNGLIPWTNDLIKAFDATQLSEYTRQLLDFNTRDVTESKKLFDHLQKSVLLLDNSQWVNLFGSFEDICVDRGIDKLHPGPKSHQLWADMIIEYLT